MSTITKLVRAVAACVFVLLPISASAQTQTTARIAGTVRDAQGAVIVRAEVAAENSATGEKRTAMTDESGGYVLTSLAPGTYQISITAHGFASALYSNIRAGISDTVTINAVLKVAGATSEVTVNDAPPLIQSSSAEIGVAIDARTLSAMPLPTRNFLQLTALAPGVSMPLTNNSAIGDLSKPCCTKRVEHPIHSSWIVLGSSRPDLYGSATL